MPIILSALVFVFVFVDDAMNSVPVIWPLEADLSA